MKARNIFLMALTAVAAMSSFVACNNDGAGETLDEGTIGLVKESAVTETVEEEIDASINEAIAYAEQKDNTKSAVTETGCATVAISPDDGSFPETITIDFGEGCEGLSGLARSGSITVILSDTLRNPGARYSVTFDNYTVGGFSVSGSKSVDNTGTTDTPSFTEESDITLFIPGGIEIHKVKTITRDWIDGTDTYPVADDVFLISGSAEVTSTAGRSYSYVITSPLKTARICENILEGEMEITWSGRDEPVTIDFGDGECDWKVYVSRARRIIRRVVFLNN